MNDIIEDLFKIYLSSIDSYNSKIYQTINDKYTIIDKSMLTTYLFIKIIEDRKEKNQEVTDVLSNYLLKQIIYGETGNLAFDISDKSRSQIYHEILDKLILEKFEYKNRIMQKLRYNYKNKEKKEIINLIIDNKFNESEYGNLIYVALNLRDVYRYSQVTTQLPENVLFHQYTVAIMSLLLTEYSNEELEENIDVYNILVKSLFHDFGEYKGTEIVTQFKNYNDLTKKMFAEIEENDEKELEGKIGTNLYIIISGYKYGAEGFISEIVDKMLGIMKLWVEVGYFHNYTFIKTINSIYQDRFKRFLRIESIDEIKNKSFYLELLREYYIYIKEHLIEKDLEYFFKYFTEEELEKFREELKLLKSNPETFLK